VSRIKKLKKAKHGKAILPRTLIPRKFRPLWLRGMDGRSVDARVLSAKMIEVSKPLGGFENLTQIQRDNVENYVHVCGLLGELEAQVRKKNRRLNTKRYIGLLESKRRLEAQLQPPPPTTVAEGDVRDSFAASFELLRQTPSPPAPAPVQQQKPRQTPRLPAPKAAAPKPPEVLPPGPTPPKDVTPPPRLVEERHMKDLPTATQKMYARIDTRDSDGLWERLKRDLEDV
jgi:hypothetical protein